MIRSLLATVLLAFAAPSAATSHFEIDIGPYVEGGSYNIPQIKLLPGEVITWGYLVVHLTGQGSYTVQGYDHEGHGEMGYNLTPHSGMTITYVDGSPMPFIIDYYATFTNYIGYDPVTVAGPMGNESFALLDRPQLEQIANSVNGLSFQLNTAPYFQFDTFYANVLASELSYTSGRVAYSFFAEVPYVEPAPEPATWAMMLAGFGAVGSVFRLRRYKATTGLV